MGLKWIVSYYSEKGIIKFCTVTAGNIQIAINEVLETGDTHLFNIISITVEKMPSPTHT